MPDAAAWRKRSIYQVLTDRFAVTGKPLCDDHVTGQYCGGTWQGIISRLDYIQGMGFDAIWISPVTKNIDDSTAYGFAYHGYWPEDIYSVNPHFGTADDLVALSDALHARGMFLMVDVVVNHMGSPPTVDYSRYVPFNHPSHYHPQRFITNYEHPQECEDGWLGDSKVPLPDLNTENPDVARTLYDWVSSLVRKFRIDGLRIDTFKHVPRDFWPGFVRAAGVWCVAEVLNGDPDYLGSFQSYCGGLLDYGTFYPLRRAFHRSGDGGMHELATLITPKYRAKFADVSQLACFMENHDMPRFINDTNADDTILRNALSWTVLSDGIPVIYYGQEQSFTGGNDPHNRELMWSSGYSVTPLYKYLALLNRTRKMSWDAGYGTSLTIPLYIDQHVLATQRGPLLMVLSNAGSKATPTSISIPCRFPLGTILVNVTTSESILIQKSTRISLVSGEPQLYLPFPLAKKLCFNITPPPPEKTAFSFRSFFKLKSAKKPTPALLPITIWSSGISVNGRPNDILVPESPLPPGRILLPSKASMRSRYSIFSISDEQRRPKQENGPAHGGMKNSAKEFRGIRIDAIAS